ncbi:MAG: hypothetical protein FWG68_04270, partial [Defluviitaleaceae bacterium]|nr:hypothetical protein [Defluviitaleaceae bacterium]
MTNFHACLARCALWAAFSRRPLFQSRFLTANADFTAISQNLPFCPPFLTSNNPSQHHDDQH